MKKQPPHVWIVEHPDSRRCKCLDTLANRYFETRAAAKAEIGNMTGCVIVKYVRRDERKTK